MSKSDQNSGQTPIDADTERVEALLRRAASFIPEHSAPDDFCANSLAKLDSTSKPPLGMKLNPFGAFAIGGATFALASIAFAIVLSGRPQATPATIAKVEPKGHPTNVAAVSSTASTPKLVETAWKPAQTEPPEPAPHTRQHFSYAAHFARLTSFWRRPRAKRQISTPLGDLPANPMQIAARSDKPATPARSCWTTEDVQQTNYVLVSPGIVTEGAGPSERATPVLVQLPIDNDYEASEGDGPAPDVNAEKQ